MRFFNTYDDLKRYQCQNNLEEDYEINEGKNELSTISEHTKLIIVGTYIPKELLYFYTGKTSYIYDAIDSVFGTKTNYYKKMLYKTTDSEIKKELIRKIIEQLRTTPIAFLDISRFVLIKKGSKSDKDIKGCVLDKTTFENIGKNVKVIAVSELAKEIMMNFLHTDSKYLKMFAGKSNEFPKGTSYKQNFIDEFKRL